MDLAFKFYSDSEKSRDFAKDCIDRQYIYCSSWQLLNDPMEGIYWWDGKSDFQALYEEKMKLKIGCLSSTYREALLWGYYGSGMHGVCIIYDVAEISDQIRSVKYIRFLQDTIDGSLNNTDKAKWLLRRKLTCWLHERERRLITDQAEVDCRVVGILIGDEMEYFDNGGTYAKRDTDFHRELLELASEKQIFAGAVRFNEPTGIVIPNPRNVYGKEVYTALTAMEC